MKGSELHAVRVAEYVERLNRYLDDLEKFRERLPHMSGCTDDEQLLFSVAQSLAGPNPFRVNDAGWFEKYAREIRQAYTDISMKERAHV